MLHGVFVLALYVKTNLNVKLFYLLLTDNSLCFFSGQDDIWFSNSSQTMLKFVYVIWLCGVERSTITRINARPKHESLKLTR